MTKTSLQTYLSDTYDEDILLDGSRSIEGRRYRLSAKKVKHELRKLRVS